MSGVEKKVYLEIPEFSGGNVPVSVAARERPAVCEAGDCPGAAEVWGRV